jgi:L-threonylcarbamoyladenylate synthase
MGSLMANLTDVVQALHQGEVIAYPTEGVFGLGCDPDKPAAIAKLLALKNRPKSKGLILIAAEFSQIAPYVDISGLSEERQACIFASWPGHVTWVLPASERTNSWVSGAFDTVAVRISAHPLVRQLCSTFGKPITSTSANRSGLEPCRTTEAVTEQFAEECPVLLAGTIGGQNNPSEIRDGRTGDVLRQG